MNKLVVIALASLLAFGTASISYADNAKTASKDTKKLSCKKQADKMKIKDKKEKAEFIKKCNKKEKSKKK